MKEERNKVMVLFYGVKGFFLLVSLMFINSGLLASEADIGEDTYYLVCTPSAKDREFQEILENSNNSIVGINLEKASNLENSVSISAPKLRYLKVKFHAEEILRNLGEKTPNLEILDIGGANILNVNLLKCVTQVPSLRVLDISHIYFHKEIPEILENILLENENLTLYVKSFRKMSPQQEMMDLSVYKSNPRVVLDMYDHSVGDRFTILGSPKTILY